MGLAVFTFGFFGTHSTVCSWVSNCCPGDKAQASSLYLLFYYCGASVIGTAAGIALSYYGWAGAVGFIGISLGLALANTGMLVFAEEAAYTELEYK
jgi:YNFM family putative membrane transporter